jgi:hypothetical protein
MDGAPGESFAAGTVILAADPAACPAGWTGSGQVVVLTSPDYAPGAAQSSTNPGVFTPATAGFGQVNFFLCVKG